MAGLLIAGLAMLPIVYLMIRAAGVDPDGLGTLLRPRTATVVLGTLALGAVVGAGSIAIGVPVAWLTTRTDLPGRRAWAILTTIPLALPSYVVGFAFLAFLGPRGTLQGLLAPFGVERLPSIGGLFGAALVLTLVSFPYVSLATRAALLRLDPAVEESARLLGDGRLPVFRRVTIPVLVPAIAAGTLLAMLYALSDFGAVSLLQFDSLSRAIFLQYGASFDRSVAAVLALVLVGMTVLLSLGEGRLRRRAGSYVQPSRRRPPSTVPLGTWRWPAITFLSAVVGLALVLPAGTVLWWLMRGMLDGEPLRLVVGIAAQTMVVGVLAATLAVVLAVPVAVLGARYPSRLASAITAAVDAGYALPGIVVALAMVFLATRTLPFLYQTIALLVAVYAVRFIAQAMGGLRASVAAVGARFEEVGRTLGDSPVRAFAHLTVPAVRPALVAGAALVFLTVVKELPLALLLGPIGFETLATEVWDAASSGFYARAAVPAAMLLLLSMATVGLLLRAEDVKDVEYVGSRT
ncbi:MAG TPA: iron ABC transporter permease [Candidatus Saccharimonadales bacterium]|nr:iron ABC transporter permease [Candidatus Saccharimonadales bacterium]